MRISSLSSWLILICLATTTHAQGKSWSPKPDWYPLGGIQAQGLVEQHGNSSVIVVKEIFSGGFAEKGGLVIGDKIVKANGKSLNAKTDADIINKFGVQVEIAEAKKASGSDFGKLKLHVVRENKKVKLYLDIAYYGPVGKGGPATCKKTAQILADALEFLKSRQKDDGKFLHQSNQQHAVAQASLAGLAWLGSGKQEYANNVVLAAEFVAEHAGKESRGGIGLSGKSKANWNQTNWSLAYGGIFLAEYIAQKENLALKRRLGEIIRQIEQNQERSGGWAHGPGGPNALNYLELEIMSNLTLGAIGMAKRLDIQVDAAKVLEGVNYVKSCTQGGGVAYSPRPGQLGVGDPGRTAGAYWAFKQLNKGSGITPAMSKYYSRGMKNLYDGHACPTMHVLNGALASALMGKKAYQKYWRVWHPFFMVSRTQNGAYGYRPTHESISLKLHPDRTWGPSFVTAHYALAMQLAQGRFKLLDVPNQRQ